MSALPPDALQTAAISFLYSHDAAGVLSVLNAERGAPGGVPVINLPGLTLQPDLAVFFQQIALAPSFASLLPSAGSFVGTLPGETTLAAMMASLLHGA